jgi:HlyD family secretion protein
MVTLKRLIPLKDWSAQLATKKPLIATALVALLAGAVGSRLLSRPAPPAASALPPAAPVALKSVTALGYLEPGGKILQVSAPNANDGSRLESLRVKEGDRVERGAILAVLNSESRLKAALNQAQAQVQVAESKLDQVRSGAKSGELDAQRSEINRLKVEKTGDYNTQSAVVARLEAEYAGVLETQKATGKRLLVAYQTAQAEADRYELLLQAGATSESLRDSKRLEAQTALRRGEEAAAEAEKVRNTLQQQLTEARAARDRAQAARTEQVDGAESTLDRIAEVRPVDIQTAQAEIAQARAAQEKAAADLEQAYVRAPQSGTVLQIHTRVGEKIAPQGVVDLGQTQRMTVRVEVYETDVQRLKLGQTAKVTSAAIGEELTGKVSDIGQKVLRQSVINTDPTSNTDARVMEVEIELDAMSSERSRRFSNSQVTAQIITDA